MQISYFETCVNPVQHAWSRGRDGKSAPHVLRRALLEGMIVLSDEVVREAQESGYMFLLCYQRLAEIAHACGRKSYHMRPKFHEMDHIIGNLSEDRLNPLWIDCSDDETFMGKLKAMGAHIHGKTLMPRLQSRYLLYLGIRWAKARREGHFSA